MVQTWSEDDHHGHPLVFSAALDSRGVLFVGMAYFYSEFDGATWRTSQPPNRGAVLRAVKGPDGCVYLGLTGDLGRMIPSAEGLLRFESFLPLLPEKHRVFSRVDHLLAMGDTMVFNLKEALAIYSRGRMTVLEPETRFQAMCLFGDQLLVWQQDRGLQVLRGDKLEPVEGSKALAGHGDPALLWAKPDGTLLLWFPQKGLVLGRITAHGLEGIHRQPGMLENYLSSARPLVICAMDGARLAIATGNGTVILDAQLGIQQLLTKASGLPSDVCNNLYYDPRGRLWVCTAEGLACVEWATPIRLVDGRHGINSYIRSVTPWPHGLLFGTMGGLHSFSLEPPPMGELPRFMRLPGSSSEAWGMIRVGSRIFATQLDSVVEATSGRVVPLPSRSKSIHQGLVASRIRRDWVWLTTSDGIQVYRVQGGGLVFSHGMPGYRLSAIQMLEDEQGRLWFWNQSNQLHRLTPSEAGDRFIEDRIYGPDQGLPTAVQNFPYWAENRLLAATQKGPYVYDPAADRFRPEPALQACLGEGQLWNLTDDGHGRLWYSGKGRAGYLEKRPDGTYHRPPQPFLRWSESRQITHFLLAPGGETIAVSSGRLLVFNPNPAWSDGSGFPCHIRRVEAFDSSRRPELLFGGAAWHRGVLSAATGDKPPELAHRLNTVRLEAAAAFFEDPGKSRYRWRLEGFDRQWTPWSAEAAKEYTNLPHGTYTFHVQARNAYGAESTIASYRLVVLPPWWQTWSFRICMGVTGLGLIYLVFRWRLAALHRRNVLLQGLVEDRTKDLRIAKDAAERASAFKSVFLATTSHEIRTPLNAILGFLQLINGGEVREQDRRQYLRIMHGAAESLLQLVNDLLDLGRIEAGALELEPIPFSLRQVVEEAQSLLASRAKERDLVMVADIAWDVPQNLRGDPHRLRQMLVNLLGNALKFTAAGHVRTAVSLLERTANSAVLRVAVEDTGEGVPASILPRLFQPYTQAESKAKQQGTGLGLSITRHLAQLMGGSVGAESQTGQGSCFWFTFLAEVLDEAPGDQPLQGCTAAIRTTSRVLEASVAHHVRRFGGTVAGDNPDLWIVDHPQAAPPGNTDVILILDPFAGPRPQGFTGTVLHRPFGETAFLRALQGDSDEAPGIVRKASDDMFLQGRVLFADDNVANRMLVHAILEQWKVEHTLVANGREAVTAFEREPFDMVILDANMPHMGGQETLGVLRQMPRGKDIPILLHSASLGKDIPILLHSASLGIDDVGEAKHLGFDDFLRKPVDLEDFRRAVATRLVPRAPERAVNTGLDLDRLQRMEQILGGPEGLDEFIGEFLADGRTRIPQLKAALADQDRARLNLLVHDLKTNAGNLGVGELHRQAAQLELDALEAPWGSLVAQLLAAELTFQAVAQQLEGRLGRLQ